MIQNFDVKSYLDANQDVKQALENGEFDSLEQYMELYGLKDIEKGLRQFHNGFEPFDESYYLELFPDLKEAIEKGVFLTGFQHFYSNGYQEIMEGTRAWTRTFQEELPEISEEKVHDSAQEQPPETKPIIIDGFDAKAYLLANPDVQMLIDNHELKDALEHLQIGGLEEIEKGMRKFHNDFEPFDESYYLESFPDLKEAIEKGTFKTAFQHFYANGYQEIIEGRRAWTRTRKVAEVKLKKIVVVLGTPRSGLTLLTAMLGTHSQTTAWFLPYSTRKDFGIIPFTDSNSIQSQYKEVFPEADAIKETIVISESTSNVENIQFIMESLKNLSENGIETKVIWVVRDVNHCYLSQNEASHKHWGDTSDPLTAESYVNYLEFVKEGYKQLIQSLSHQDHTIVSYQNLISQPETVMQKIMHYIDLESEQKQLNVSNFKDLKIAGDPGFSEYLTIDKKRESERAGLWKDQQSLPHVLDDYLSLFVQEFNLFVNKVQADKFYDLSAYQKDLLDLNFDRDYYLKTCPDIAKADLDPLVHYMDHGWEEGRDPNETFDVKRYRDNVHNGSVFNPLIHYCLIGRYEAELKKFGLYSMISDLILIDPEKYEITDALLLEAPLFKDPEVSIIIPAYNQEKYTLACVESIINNTKDVTYEIIIMDDKSPDRSAREIGKYMKNVIFHSNKKNLGFLLNCNKGVTFSKGKYLLFLNNDTNVQPGWLSTLVELIDPDKKIGMVGSRLVYPDGRQQEAGGIVWNDASGWNFGRLDDAHKPEYNYVKEADYLTGAAMMIWKPLWDEIGGFDERYVPAYYEDTDLAFEVRKHGYKALFQPKSVVIHFEGISNGTDLGSGIKQYQVVNKEKFFDKWEKELTEKQFPNAEDVFLARDRSGGKKHLLFVDHYLPHYDQDAGSKAAFQYLQILVKNNIQVHFLGDNFYDYPETPYLDALQQMGIEVLHGDWYAEHWEEWFRENGHYFDYIILSRPHIAEKYISIAREASDAKIIYFGHDLHFLRERREYEIKQDEIYLDNSVRWLKLELDLIHQSDISYFFSDVEKQEIQKIHPYASVDVVPLYIYDTFKDRVTSSNKRRDIMFVGGFAHAPNTDAMIWFVENVWQHIEKKVPGIKFYIIGSKPSKEVRALASQSVIVTGYIEDEKLDEYYNHCKVAVAPLRYGAGIKGKVVDALYNGMPLVTTSIGAEGLDDATSVMMIADKPKAFAQSVLSLYLDDGLADQYATKALAYCQAYFSEERAKSKMAHIFTEFKEAK